jgi:hypothetical protein
MKQASGRPQDMEDIKALRKLKWKPFNISVTNIWSNAEA